MNDEKIKDIANKLITIKNDIASLQKHEKELKRQLEPHIPIDEQLVLPTGSVYGYSQKVVRTFNRNFVLGYLRDNYGKKVAQAVNLNCTIKKFTPQRLHVRMNKDQAD